MPDKAYRKGKCMKTLGIIALIIIISGVIGYFKGLIKMALSIATLIISILLSSVVSPKIAELAKKNEDIYNSVHKKVEEKVNVDKLKDRIDELSENQILELGKGDKEKLMKGVTIPPQVKKMIVENEEFEKIAAKGSAEAQKYIYKLITDMIITAAAYILVFIVSTIILNVISAVINLSSKLPVINSVNKIAGAAAGVAEGFIIMWVFFIFMGAFSSYDFIRSCNKDIDDNALLKHLYNNNLVMYLIDDDLKENAKQIYKDVQEEVDKATEEAFEKGKELTEKEKEKLEKQKKEQEEKEQKDKDTKDKNKKDKK